MGLSAVRILLPRAKTHPFLCLKILKKIMVIPGTRENKKNNNMNLKYEYADHISSWRRLP